MATSNASDPVKLAYQSANKSFYAPGVFTLPDIALNFSGTFLRYPATATAIVAPTLNPQESALAKEILPPWEIPATSDPKSEATATPEPGTPPVSDDQSLKIPYRPQLDSSAGPAKTDLSALIGYSFDPGFTLESRFNSPNPNSADLNPNQLTSNLDYLNLKYSLSGKINYNLSLPANLG